MPGAILGEKADQSQIFNKEGDRLPITFIKTDPCYLVKINPNQSRNYVSVQLGFGQAKKIKKSIAGQLKKAGINTPLRFLKEIKLRVENLQLNTTAESGQPEIKIGDLSLKAGNLLFPDKLFKVGDKVDVSGISKGKGFQGVVKRYHFAGGPRTHGQSDRARAPGSIGQTTTPGRVFKGKRMAGRMGGRRVTVKNLEIVKVDKNGVYVKGLVPGGKGGLIEIKVS